MNLILLLYGGALAHFGILIASGLAPKALDWKGHLAPLPTLLRQMFWVYGAFIVMMIIGFGTITAMLAPELASGGPVARAFCGLVAVFWLVRLGVQFFVFDPGPFLTRRLYRFGYHLLTVVFIGLTLLYGYAAIA